MKYTVYQISYTDSDIDAITSGVSNPKHDVKSAMSIDFSGEKTVGLAERALHEGLYTAVSYIEANDLDQVFEIGNIGPETNIIRLNRMSSVSVGDLIEDEDGNRHVVASFGFKEVA